MLKLVISHNVINKFEYFILALFSIIGYATYFPYFISNIILFLIPMLFFINIIFFDIKISIKYIIYTSLCIITGLIPFIFYTNIFLLENNITAIILRTTGPFLIYLIVKNLNLDYNEISRILIPIYFLNLLIVLIQFFIFNDVKLINNGNSVEWTSYDSEIGIINRRAVGLLGNANSLGAFVLILVLFLENYLIDKIELKRVILITAFLTIVFFAKSRNVTITAFIIYFYKFLINKKKYKAIFLAFLAIFLLFLLQKFKDSTLIDAIFRINLLSEEGNTLQIRSIVNFQAINIWKDNFILFGGGASSEYFYMDKFNSLRNYSEMLYTKALLEGGIVGLFSYLFFLFYVIQIKIKTQIHKTSFKMILFAILIISFAETVFYLQQLYFFTFILLGSYVSIEKNATEDKLESPNLKIEKKFEITK